jgi:hypothetical protein
MSILTVGSSPGRGMSLNLPVVIVPLRHMDNGYWIFQPPAAYLGDEQTQCCVVHPRSGSFGPHGHRIDFCESSDPVASPQSEKCFCSKMVKALRSHRNTVTACDCGYTAVGCSSLAPSPDRKKRKCYIVPLNVSLIIRDSLQSFFFFRLYRSGKTIIGV